MNVAVDVARGPDTRTARFFDFEHPEGRLNDFVVTTQFRVRRGTHRQAHDARANLDDDQRMVIPDLVLFVNDSPSASAACATCSRSSAVRSMCP